MPDLRLVRSLCTFAQPYRAHLPLCPHLATYLITTDPPPRPASELPASACSCLYYCAAGAYISQSFFCFTSNHPSTWAGILHGLGSYIKGVYHTHQLVGLRLPWRLDSHETHYELCQPLNYPPHRATQWGVDATCSPLHGHTLLAWLLRQRSRDITVCGRRRRRRGRWKKNTKRKFCTHKHRNRRKTQTHIRASAPSAEFRVPERAPCAPPMNETYLL